MEQVDSEVRLYGATAVGLWRIEQDEYGMPIFEGLTGMAAVRLNRDEFEQRYRARFRDPAFAPLQKEISAVIAAAWSAYSDSRPSPAGRHELCDH
ncbi:MAG: hypothetical protein ABWY18_03315 [Tardiphaga sp.]